jgi:hypothetical protein
MSAEQFSAELTRIKDAYTATMETIRAEAYDSYLRNLATLTQTFTNERKEP